MTEATPVHEEPKPTASSPRARAKGLSEHIRRFVGFAFLPACSLLASMTLLPLISHSQGRAGWVALGVGQGIGAIVGVIAGLAWPTIGGNEVARTPQEKRPQIFVSSVYSRLLALAALLPISVAACLLLVSDYRIATTLFMAGTGLNAMTASWYYSGLGEPRMLVINEGAVRLGGYAISAAALAVGAPLATYAALTVVAGLVSLVLNWLHIVGLTIPRPDGLYRQTLRTVSDHRLGTASRVLLSAFAYGGTPIFTAFAPATAPIFAALDQLQRATSNATSVFPQTFVAWVSRDEQHRKRRGTFAFGLLSAVGLLIVISWTLFGPFIVEFLFSGKAHIDRVGCFLVGLNVASALLAASYQLLVMIPLGMKEQVFKINCVYAVLGLILLTALSVTREENVAFAAWSILNLVALPYLMHVQRRANSSGS